MSEGVHAGAIEALHHCELFGFLVEDDRERLAGRSKTRRFQPGDWLAREGEVGEEMFVLIEGVIEVVTEVRGEDVILARLDQPGQYAGEQALREPGGKRSAALRAASGVEVLVIDQPAFTEASECNPALAEHVRQTGERQAQQLSLVERSVMYRALAAFDQAEGWSREEQYQDGEPVFREGDAGEAVYVIRQGNARVTRTENGEEILLAMLHEGQTFGELAVMEGGTRQATVAASGLLEVVAFDRERFLEATARVPELHEYLGTLKRVYALGDGLATQFDGEFRGRPALVTLIRLDDQREAVIHHAQDLYSASVGEDDEGIEELRFEDSRRGILRTLGLDAGRLVRVHAEGPWQELDRVHQALLDSASPTSSDLERFQSEGHLFESARQIDYNAPDALLCHCLRLRRQDLESVMARGAETLDDLQAETGATSVCGGCSGRIATLMGSSGQPVRLLSATEAGKGVRCFRFQPAADEASGEEGEDPAEALRVALPGQHVVISARIDDHWVHRPYTISSAGDCTQWREITVKREPHGLLSNWLFGEPGEAEIRLSHPKGTFWADLDRPEPIVCLVAGIGVTPAVAIARSIEGMASPRELLIDYSARTEPEFSHKAELDLLDASNESITVRYRCTGAGERLDRDALADIRAQHPDASYFICGPRRYQEAIESELKGLGVRPQQIHAEVFTDVGHAPAEPSFPRSSADRLRAWVLMGMTSLYLAQDLLGWHIPALSAAQQSLAWASITGLLMIGLVVYQWVLPALRLRGKLSATAAHYRWHKALGVAAPLLLYLHSVTLGYAYTAFLCGSWLVNAVLGAFDKTVKTDPGDQERYLRWWLPAHVVLSCVITVLALVHIYIAYAYK